MARPQCDTPLVFLSFPSFGGRQQCTDNCSNCAAFLDFLELKLESSSPKFPRLFVVNTFMLFQRILGPHIFFLTFLTLLSCSLFQASWLIKVCYTPPHTPPPSNIRWVQGGAPRCSSMQGGAFRFEGAPHGSSMQGGAFKFKGKYL